MFYDNTLNLKQELGGSKIKQGDFGSVLSFILLDGNGSYIDELNQKTASISLCTDDKILYVTTATINNSTVEFKIDKAIPVGIYYVEIKVDNYIFPSDRSTIISIEQGATVYDLKDLIPNYDVSMTLTDILNKLNVKDSQVVDLQNKMNAIYSNALSDHDEILNARGGQSSLDGRLDVLDAKDTNLQNQINTNKSSIISTNSRIDNIIATAGDGTVPSELTDIRVSNDGTVHATAREAIINEFDNLYNLVDKVSNGYAAIFGKYALGAISYDGTINDASQNSLYSDVINLSPGSVIDIKIKDGYKVRIAEYDSSNVFKKLTNGTYLTSNTTVTINNPKIRIGILRSDSAKIKVEESNNIELIILNNLELKVNQKLIDYPKTSTGKNKYNHKLSEKGYISATGQITASDLYVTSALIPVFANLPITISPRFRKFIAFDASKIPLASTFIDGVAENYTYTPQQDGYIRVSFYAEDGNCQVEYSSIATSYEPFTNYLPENVSLAKEQLANINNDSVLKDKVFLTFGDSIMHGDGNGGIGIADLLSTSDGIIPIDKSVGGATMTYKDGASHIIAQIQTAISDTSIKPDCILIDGLSNDVSIGAPLGSVSNSFDYVNNGYPDFAKALDYAFGLLRTSYPSVPIIYIIPHSTPSRNYDNELIYGDLARKACQKWSIPIADIYQEGNLNARIDAVKQLFAPDGTHPNKNGYEHCYLPLIKSIYKKIAR